MTKQEFKTKRIDHLGLVAALCNELMLSEYIDGLIPHQSDHRNISYGKLLVAMILNGLGFTSRTLHMIPDYFSEKPVERLLGDGIKAAHINDDATGRCLDKLYALGVSEVYQGLAEKVVLHLGLPCDVVHLDSTSFHVDGEYLPDLDSKAIHLTKGYSRDHRPDLNQVVLNLITENQAGLPVYMQACSGNTNDSDSFKKLVKCHLSSLKAAQRCQYFIGDAALYTKETIQALVAQGQYFISRVPQKISEAKALIKSQSGVEFTALKEGYSAAWFDATYGEAAQKWLLIKSEQATKRERDGLKKSLVKSTELSIKSFNTLSKQRFDCEKDAMTALEDWECQQDYVRVAQKSTLKIVLHKTRGRPKSDSEGVVQYQIDGQLYTSLPLKETAENENGVFILATNDCRGHLSMQEMLDHYKSQQAVERGFRFLKSPDFLTASLFLKKPERIEALLMVMTCCLMIYAALEHLIRRRLVEAALFFPDMKNKPSQKPTARWVFFCFQGIDELTVNAQAKVIINIKSRQEIILNCLGDPYWKLYS